jgi:hypothetical protein
MRTLSAPAGLPISSQILCDNTPPVGTPKLPNILARGNSSRRRNAEKVMNNSKSFRFRQDRKKGDLYPGCCPKTRFVIITIASPNPVRRIPSYHGVRE